MPRPTLAALLLVAWLTCLPATAEPRSWRNSDGSRTFSGDYLSHDANRVSIRGSDGRVFTLELGKLHPDDRAWLAAQPARSPATHPDPLPDDSAVFDTLKFGDSLEQVTAKLKASKAVELTIGEIYLPRVGLNGSFRTCRKIGGQHCLLFFDWTDKFHLKELTLQTEPLPLTAYSSTLHDTWQDLVKLMTTLHGSPASATSFPPAAQLSQEGMVLGSHLWRVNGHSALLGTARDNAGYSVIVRFTTDPIPTPAAP